ncbi:hypothetical protein FNV43_RR20860 [Rhamnella rubrinervis]|uniref:NAC domain-containing protein n=1 Tax=Rhamnella rubrinervis TaxID=2594499 RepID=A0A8K0E1J4_9ROSA|nr:hypothetical protein FNV43_RR20860 [Rhamnella rubrinervis]
MVLNELPVGYRFLPTDEELVKHYLLNKVINQQVPATVIQDIDADVLYSQPPNDIVTFPCGEREWFFFISHKMEDENMNEHRSCRSSGAVTIRIVGNGRGFWKSNGGEIPVNINEGNIFAYKLCFTYFSGPHPDHGKKTHWVLEEIHLSQSSPQQSSKMLL